MNRYRYLLVSASLLFSILGCSFSPNLSSIFRPNTTPTPLPGIAVRPGMANPNEPVVISGDIPYTSPFFINSIQQPFILLEDEAGFVKRDHEFTFPLNGQVIGPVEIHPDDTLTYRLALPQIPQSTLVDVDNDGEGDTGVQVFAIAYWSNIWNGPFLEEREGKGWSTAYSSALTDPENDDEIVGGTLLVWAPDDNQSFPTGFGDDGLLFTEDDPVDSIPAGYNLVDLDVQPFRIYKEAQPNITLIEGEVEVNNYSEMSYEDAFTTMFEKASTEYPFTEEKAIDWDGIYEKYLPRFEKVSNSNQFYKELKDFTMEIPDGHVAVSINPEVFYNEAGGGFGLVLVELSDGKIIASEVLPGKPAARAGIKPGDEIISWNGQPVAQVIEKIVPEFGPFSTDHVKRINQVTFLTRVPPETRVQVTFQNPIETQENEVSLIAEPEYDSLFKTIPSFEQDQLSLPIEGHILDDSGLGYVRITTFSDDYSMMARLWEHYIQGLIDEKVPGLIIDLRANGGGSTDLSLNFAGYFFDKEIELYQRYYYNSETGSFEESGSPARIVPAPQLYEGEIAVLVGPDCVSACEGFAHMLSQEGRAVIVGHYPSAGAFGDVGRGQYKMPEELDMQFPTGRPETPDGEVLIEGVGITPDILVPVTSQNVLGENDAVLDAAVKELLSRIK